MEINVYDKDGNVVKTSEAQFIDIRFGAVRNIMKLLKIDDVKDTGNLLTMVYDAWEELTVILSDIFPDITGDEWDDVKLNELVPVVLQIIKKSFTQIMSIPKDPKN